MKKLSTLIVMLTATVVLPLSAQSLRSAYFMDGSFQRSMLNPALQPDKGYVAFPLLSGLTFDVNSNLGLANFLYPTSDGRLTTFMNGSVSASEFLGGLSDANALSQGLDWQLFGLGFKMLGGYSTLSINLHEEAMANVPYDVFRFMKEGFQNSSYNINNLSVGAQAYASVEVGHSMNILDVLSVGARVKFLMGIANANFNLENINLSMTEDRWMVNAQSQMQLALLGGVTVDEKTNPDGGTDYSLSVDGYMPKSYGAAIDLGAAFNFDGIVDGFTVSAGITNLGFIGWKNMMSVSPISGSFSYDGMGEIDYGNMESVSDEVEQMGDDLSSLLSFGDADYAKKTMAVAPTIALGAEYAMPFYDKLTAGLLFSSHVSKIKSYNDLRLYANLSPVGFFQMSANVGVSNYGTEFGWYLNLHPKGFALYLGSDFFSYTLSPQFIPVKRACASVSMGINIPF